MENDGGHRRTATLPRGCGHLQFVTIRGFPTEGRTSADPCACQFRSKTIVRSEREVSRRLK